MSELEPCPNPWCCARSAPLPVKSTYADDAWRVRCECGVVTHRQDTVAEAVAAWNHRPPSAREERLREALVTIGKAIEQSGCWPPRRIDAVIDGVRKVVDRALKEDTPDA